MSFHRYCVSLIIVDIGGKKKVRASITARTEHEARRNAIQTALAQGLQVKSIKVNKVKDV